MKKQKVLEYQKAVLNVLAGRIDDFYLAGGTALSLFYFQHRLSIDLDFFTANFSDKRVNEIISYIKENLKREIKLISHALDNDKAKIKVYNVYFSEKDVLKIDFVEDLFKLIGQPKLVDGIKILSLEDIYIRKLHAIAGIMATEDIIGRKKFLGGRLDAKDFCDVYFLSTTFMPLSKFTDKYSDISMEEGLISWFRTYDRMQMMDGVLSLDIEKKANYRDMEKHFAREINNIIRGYIE